MGKERFDPGMEYIGTGEYIPVMEPSPDGDYVRYSYAVALENALRDAIVYADSQLLVPQKRASKWKALLREGE